MSLWPTKSQFTGKKCVLRGRLGVDFVAVVWVLPQLAVLPMDRRRIFAHPRAKSHADPDYDQANRQAE